MDGVDEGDGVIDGGSGEDAVAEVEYVTGSGGGLIENAFGSLADLARAGEEGDRVDVALNGHVVAETGPHVVQFDAPIETDDVGAGVTHLFQQRGGVCTKIDDGHVGLNHSDQSLDVSEDELVVISG